jgi:hypothetical protein
MQYCIRPDYYIYYSSKLSTMNKFFRAIIAFWGAKKFGGGCLGSIVLFIIIYWALGHCN